MADKDDKELKALEMRIATLETLLDKSVQREITDVSADEIRAYKKVKDLIAADWGEFCGINDCFRCIIFRCYRCFDPPKLCDVECSCGPCMYGGYSGIAQQRKRFRDLGE